MVRMMMRLDEARVWMRGAVETRKRHDVPEAELLLAGAGGEKGEEEEEGGEGGVEGWDRL